MFRLYTTRLIRLGLQIQTRKVNRRFVIWRSLPWRVRFYRFQRYGG